MSLFKKETNIIGLDIGTTGIRLVEVKPSKTEAKLVTYGSVTIDTKVIQSDASVDQLSDGIVKFNSDVIINGGQMPTGRRATVVVGGDIYITDNITYKRPFSKLSDIPSLGIIATGNIYVDPTVTALYGIYYAGSTIPGSTGIINTCQRGISVEFDPAITSNADQCERTLTISGALFASSIYFRRTAGDANNINSPAAETVSNSHLLMLRPPYGMNWLKSPAN